MIDEDVKLERVGDKTDDDGRSLHWFNPDDYTKLSDNTFHMTFIHEVFHLMGHFWKSKEWDIAERLAQELRMPVISTKTIIERVTELTTTLNDCTRSLSQKELSRLQITP